MALENKARLPSTVIADIYTTTTVSFYTRLKTLQRLKNLKNLYSKNCVALENNIYSSLPSTVVTNMVYDYGGKLLSRWRSRKQVF